MRHGKLSHSQSELIIFIFDLVLHKTHILQQSYMSGCTTVACLVELGLVRLCYMCAGFFESLLI